MRARLISSIVLATLVAVGTTGCGFVTPQATQIAYNPSDGTSANTGDLKVRNAFAIVKDGNANLVMWVLNTGDSAATVNLQYNFGDAEPGQGETVSFTIPAGESISFGNPDVPQLILEGMEKGEPGGHLPIFVQSGDDTGTTMFVPLLEETFIGYETLAPSPKPTPTAAPEPTETPAP